MAFSMRPTFLIGIALFLGLLASVLVLRVAGSASSADGTFVVIAKSDISPGMTIEVGQVQLVSWPQGAEPQGSSSRLADVVGRVSRSLIIAGEPILDMRLAPKTSRSGLPVMIETGKRAISIRVNEAIALPGFAWPGSYVDVLVSASDPSGSTFSKIVLRRVKVLATSADEKADPKQPRSISAVTLQLSPTDTERLDLARAIGTLSIAMRNEFDAGLPSSNGARVVDLVGGASIATTSLRTELPTAGVNASKKLGGASPYVEPEVRELRGVKEGQR